jgi:hypothetical protein
MNTRPKPSSVSFTNGYKTMKLLSINWHSLRGSCLHFFLTLSRWVGNLLALTGFIALLWLWVYIKEARIEQTGHYDTWFFRQVCPNTVTTTGQEEIQVQHRASLGHPIPPVWYTERFYEACANEAKH